MAAQAVVIEFVVDYSGLDQAIDTMEKLGQLDAKVAQEYRRTTAEVNKQSQAIKNTANAYKGPTQSIEQLDKKTKQFVKDFVDGFQEGITEELKRAKPEIDAFRKKLEEAGKGGVTATQSLKKELRDLTEQIARVKASGGPVDAEMLKRAGQLKDAIADANQEIKNAGSDTRGIDNVVGSISALAGGFSAVQGAVGLFTEDSEELQKVLLKVNSAMALATGIQQVANAVQKEGSLAKLVDTVATKGQIAVQQLYTLVTGRATAATVAFKVALATTGIGLLVIGILTLINALSSAEDQTEDLIKSLDDLRAANEGVFKSMARDEKEQIALLEERGAKESEVSKLQLGYLEDRIRKKKQEKILAEQIYKQSIRNGEVDNEVAANFTQSNQDYMDALSDRRVLQTNIRTQEVQEQKEAQEERLKKQKEANEKALQLAREARAAEFSDFKAGVELQLLEVAKGSQEELELKKRLTNAELLIDLEGEKLTLNQKKLLIKQYFEQVRQLDIDSGKQSIADAAANEQSRLQGQLSNLNLANEEKIALNISLLEIIADQEKQSAEGNAAKIKAINQKLATDIATARVNAIKAAAEYELSIFSATGGAARRALERVANDEKQKADIRINTIKQLEVIDLASIQKRIDANREAADVQGSDQKALNLEYEQLLDDRNKIQEDADQKIVDLNKAKNEQIRAENIRLAEDIISVFSQVVSVLDSIFSLSSEKENQKIQEQKQKLKDLQEAGAITEKEAIIRQKRIEADERRAKNQQAHRDKQIAVFNALLAIPSAILQGLKVPGGGPILAAIYGAIATAQAAIVIARPVPKFSKGKKDRYEGPGIMGDAGAELMQRADGSFHVATKPTLVYVGSRDKIFTHTETKSMIPNIDRSLMREKDKPFEMDYDKLAAAIMKGHRPDNVDINIDNTKVGEETVNALLRAKYFDKYYSSKH